jgi:hypothetical protein
MRKRWRKEVEVDNLEMRWNQISEEETARREI